MFTKKPTGAGLVVTVTAVVAMVFAPAAFAHGLWTSSAKTTPLRGLTTGPTNQPDAGEFVNNGPVSLATAAGTITCNEMEFGTTVKKNPANTTAEAVELAIPFGVAEAGDGAKGDTGCNVETPSGPAPVFTYFDTNEQGAVGTGATTVATANATGAVGTANNVTFHNIAFSQRIPTATGGHIWCKGNVNGLHAKLSNPTGEVVEEGRNAAGEVVGMTVAFEGAKVPIENPTGAPKGEECALAPSEATLTGSFFLETPSTNTEGWWYE